MEWLELLYDILKVCIIPLLGVTTTYIVKYLKSKEKEINDKLDNDTAEKYISMLSFTIQECVTATTQTYVESLKKQGKFDAEAQKTAFEMTYNAVLNVLTEDAKDYLTAVYGDLGAYMTNKIEAEVQNTKNEIIK